MMRRAGFTLMEIMTVIVIVSILGLMLLPVLRGIEARMEKAKCMANLRNLHIAANAYIQNQGHWPQIDPNLMTASREQYYLAWIETLRPYSIGEENWICATVQKQLGNPDYLKDPLARRIDYFPCPFDDNPTTPYRLTRQPWFIERADAHGSGNLLIFGDGSVRDLSDVMRQ